MSVPVQHYRAPTVARREQVSPELLGLPPWVHPAVAYNYTDWLLLRDAADGEKAVKEGATTYLPQSDGMDDDEYTAYLDRASYYNFTGRTIGAMNGTLFRRRPVLSNVPDRFSERLKNVSADNLSLFDYFATVGKELIHMGRVGVLLDLPSEPSTQPEPYFTTYKAEHILDWETKKIKGRNALIYVVLRETEQKSSRTTVTDSNDRSFRTRFRVLSLDGGEYSQTVYANPDGKSDAELKPEHAGPTVYPIRNGARLNFIPFIVFGPEKNSMDVARSPMLDIALTNISHYRSSAELEQGLFYTGFPVYYAEIGQGAEGGADYELAPNRVWETPTGTKPGLLEFNGHGLKFLENALDRKESQAASLGGRMIGIRTAAVSESDNSLRMKELNEHAALLGIAKTLDSGGTILLSWWLRWAGASESEAKQAEIEFNKDFVFDGIGSREFRAVHAMYKDGILPIEVVYDYLKKALVIPDWMGVDEFKKLLDKMESFPNQPDAEARMNGYPNKQSEIDDDNAEKDREDAQKARDDAAKQAEKLAKRAQQNPGNPGGPPAAQRTNSKGAPGRPGSGGPAKTVLK